MFTLTLKSWNGSLLNGLARALGRKGPSRNMDVTTLSPHMLRDLGICQDDATDFLAAERVRFPI